MNIPWYPIGGDTRYATVAADPAPAMLRLVVERLPSADSWRWTIWRSGRSSTRLTGQTLSETLSMAFAAKAAERLLASGARLTATGGPAREVIPVADEFQIAAERARIATRDVPWDALSAREQAEAIYREQRAMDAERAARQPPPST